MIWKLLRTLIYCVNFNFHEKEEICDKQKNANLNFSCPFWNFEEIANLPGVNVLNSLVYNI